MFTKLKAKIKSWTAVDWCRLSGLGLCVLFCLFSMVFFLIKKDVPKALMGLSCIFFLSVPDSFQRLFRFRIQTALYFFILIYAICPLLGFSYKFYYMFGWWDDLLHCFGGVVFAMFGAYLPKVINKKAPVSLALCALFGLVFSIAVSGVWEFIEFGMDSIFRTDMQKDTVLIQMRPSYLLGEMLGLPIDQMGDFGKITDVTVNGTNLAGYIDVGLLDTMGDMLIQSLGAVVYTAIYLIGKGKFFVFVPLGKRDTELLNEQEQPKKKHAEKEKTPNETAEEEVAITK